jgi:hypothetical protein
LVNLRNEISHEKMYKAGRASPLVQPALEINYVDCYISFEKTGFLASNRISLLSEFELWSTHQLHATAEPYGVIDPWNRFLGSSKVYKFGLWGNRYYVLMALCLFPQDAPS